eukprot:jgi/Psemu1/31583/gm1.31583_g
MVMFTTTCRRLFVVVLFTVLKLPTKSAAFTSKISYLEHSSFPSFESATSLLVTTAPNHDGFYEGDNNGNHSVNNDDAFYRDFQRAKEQKAGVGSQLPTEKIEDDQYYSYNDGGDEDFYRALQRAKLKKLGGSIPPEQVKESAAQAEADFLQAMKETKTEFQKAKEELGSDGAVDLFLDRIREEDKFRDEKENDEKQ